jgi:Salmonella virulence plasmid 65kDa B protein.
MRKLIVILSFCALHVSAQTNEFGYPVAPNMSSADTGIPFTSTMNYDVTAMGGAAFSFPIKIPKGLPGVEPSISINYNSQAGNGIVGYGSNISGLSVISVVPRDKFHDGTASGCRWNGTDAFSLDGVRLILKEGTYGANGSVYSLESSSYSRIILHRTDVNGVVNIWFEYTDKDGVTYTYGNTSDSRQDFVGHDGIRRTNSWYVNRVQNSVGNYMTYSYIQDSLYVYPSIIRYGMNTTNASLVNTITFNYQDRVFDRDPLYVKGGERALCAKYFIR